MKRKPLNPEEYFGINTREEITPVFWLTKEIWCEQILSYFVIPIALNYEIRSFYRVHKRVPWPDDFIPRTIKWEHFVGILKPLIRFRRVNKWFNQAVIAIVKQYYLYNRVENLWSIPFLGEVMGLYDLYPPEDPTLVANSKTFV